MPPTSRPKKRRLLTHRSIGCGVDIVELPRFRQAVAKEAVIKALSQIHPTRAVAMHQVEVRNDRLGRPHIILHVPSLKRVKVHVSLSHVDTVAVASAIAMRS